MPDKYLIFKDLTEWGRRCEDATLGRFFACRVASKLLLYGNLAASCRMIPICAAQRRSARFAQPLPRPRRTLYCMASVRHGLAPLALR
jgi:hypothetical protein